MDFHALLFGIPISTGHKYRIAEYMYDHDNKVKQSYLRVEMSCAICFQVKPTIKSLEKHYAGTLFQYHMIIINSHR